VGLARSAIRSHGLELRAVGSSDLHRVLRACPAQLRPSPLAPRSNNLRNDLSHPNEFIRGCTLRFLCKLKEAEILEPLIPTIKNNLEHRHAFVRRNAVLAVFAIHKSFEYLLPDGPELVEAVLQQEQDASCKRNAFLMLFHSSQERAVEYLSQNLEQVANWSDILQLVVLELIRKIVRNNPYEKSRYIRCILTLFSSESHAVVYECASVLVALSNSATAIRAAANSYVQLLSSQSDNNIKLIVLERLQDLKRQHSKVLQEMIMDIIRALSSANLDIRKKTLEIMLDLIVPKNIAEVMQVLKKEVQKTQGEEGDKNTEYRAMLINAIHKSAIRFPESASTVVPVLMDFLGDSNQNSAVEVILFVREILETFPHLRGSVMHKLLQTFPSIHSSRVARVALWLMGEFCVSGEEVAAGFTTLKASLGELPFQPTAGGEAAAANGGGGRVEGRPVVLADGTYASVMAVEDSGAAGDGAPKLRGLLVGGDYFLATVVATTLTKLALRSRAHLPLPAANMVAADVMLILAGMLQLGKAGQAGQAIDTDSQERLTTYLRLLSSPGEDVQQLCLVHCHEAFSAMLSERASQEEGDRPAKESVPEVNRQADDLIMVRQLKGGKAETAALEFDDDDDIVASATGAFKGELDFAARLKRVTQLTGLSDPVYAEAYVLVHAYDIMLDVLVINQTQVCGGGGGGGGGGGTRAEGRGRERAGG
jgi:coatomer subunit beta